MATDFRTIERLLQLAKKYKIAEMNLEDGKFKIHFKTARAVAASTMSGPVTYVTERQGASEGASSHSSGTDARNALSENMIRSETTSQKSQDDSKYHKVISPFVGTFYRAPSPEADSYVKEGQVIRKGDVLCIVEAMKLMNEIESEVSGKIVSCLVENGQPVEYGEPLFLVDPL